VTDITDVRKLNSYVWEIIFSMKKFCFQTSVVSVDPGGRDGKSAIGEISGEIIEIFAISGGDQDDRSPDDRDRQHVSP
jgi:hypothetical protein